MSSYVISGMRIILFTLRTSFVIIQSGPPLHNFFLESEYLNMKLYLFTTHHYNDELK